MGPCLCTGSIKYVHEECLIMKWMKTSTSKTCELCKQKITTELKPFAKWERIDLTEYCEYEYGNLLGRAISLIIAAAVAALVMWLWVKSWNKYRNASLTNNENFT